jgi:hypothetical protein
MVALGIVLSALPGSQEKPRPVPVSLEDILACQTDPLIVNIFNLNGDAVEKLILGGKKYDAASAASHGYAVSGIRTISSS